MSYEIVESSPKAKGAVTGFESIVNIDYLQLSIGQSFKIPATDLKIGTIRMNAKRFMQKHPHIKIKVVSHKKDNLIEVARVPMDNAMNVGTEE